jgi:hypothetical protein
MGIRSLWIVTDSSMNAYICGLEGNLGVPSHILEPGIAENIMYLSA